MRKRLLILLAAVFLLAGLVGVSQAELVTIGTAQFDGTGTEYNLIWNDDNNGNSVVWLDYTNSITDWQSQVDWAAGLNSESALTYDIDSAYSVDWGVNSWRLPATAVGPIDHQSFDGSTTIGYNITSSEMGHLYYTELGNLGVYDTSGDYQEGAGLVDTKNFDNLFDYVYWSGTELPDHTTFAWVFNMALGLQSYSTKVNSEFYGLAVRSGDVSAVPVPGAIYLLGSGLIGLAALRRRKQGNRR